MRILVTRPAEDTATIAALLTARGHEVIVAPLLTVHLRDGPEIPLGGVQAILATSANGVRALARRTARRDVAVFAVGPQTAEAAVALGFADVRNAQGDARMLVVKSAQWARPAQGALLHARGADADGVLASSLRDAGFDVRTEMLYDVTAAPDLPREVRAEMTRGGLDAALFFSPRSARAFRDAVVRAEIDTAGLLAICISANAAAALAPLALREIHVAAEPNQAAMVACLEAALRL